MRMYLQNSKIKKAFLVSTIAFFMGGQTACFAHTFSYPAIPVINLRDTPPQIVQTFFFFLGLSVKFMCDRLAEQIPSDPISSVQSIFYPDAQEQVVDENGIQIASNSTALQPYSFFGEAARTSTVKATSVGLIEAAKKLVTAKLLSQGFTALEIAPASAAFTAGSAIPLLSTVSILYWQMFKTLYASVYNDDLSTFLYRFMITGFMVRVGLGIATASCNVGSKIAKVLAGDSELVKKPIERYLEVMLAAAFTEGILISLASLFPDEQPNQDISSPKVPCHDLMAKRSNHKTGSNDSFDTHQEWCENVDPFFDYLQSSHTSYNNMTLSLPKKDLEGAITAARLGLNYYKGVFPGHVQLMRNLGLMNYFRNVQEVSRALTDRS